MQRTFSGSTDSSIRRSVAVKESLKGELNYDVRKRLQT